MPKYLPLPSLEAALAKSHDIALALGCGREQRDVTQYWFAMTEHESNGQGALIVPAGDEALLDLDRPTKAADIVRPAVAKARQPKAATLAALKDEGQMKAQGWLKGEAEK